MPSTTRPCSDLKHLVRAPAVAWPTLFLLAGCLAVIFLFIYLAMSGVIPYWVATLINGTATYFIFSPAHDSTHGAVSTNKTLNDAVGHVAMLFFGPLAPLPVVRWIHMQHHRFTNDHEKDPDAFGHKIDLFTPVRWAMVDLYYSLYFLKHAGPMRDKYLPRFVAQILFSAAIFFTLNHFGYGLEAFMFWILPTRISSIFFTACFVCLPHTPFLATAQENEYQASNIRAGCEWLLTPLLAFQNYHLVHHLYPTAPFYNMIKIWNAKLDQHLANNPFYVSTFSIGKQVSTPKPQTGSDITAPPELRSP